jgi:hypothetical protein
LTEREEYASFTSQCRMPETVPLCLSCPQVPTKVQRITSMMGERFKKDRNRDFKSRTSWLKQPVAIVVRQESVFPLLNLQSQLQIR